MMRYGKYMLFGLLLLSCKKEPQEYAVHYIVNVPQPSRVIIHYVDNGQHKSLDEKLSYWRLDTKALPGDTISVQAQNLNLQNGDWVHVSVQYDDGQPYSLSTTDSGFNCSASESMIVR